MSKYIYYFTILILLSPPLLHAQQLDSMLNIYATRYPQEKIHIQLDKKIYRAGETIWFKAYIFTGADPSLQSRNFYAELTDASGAVMQRKIYPITESSSAGSFDLPKNIPGRRLHLRAYTTWMTNFDTTFYFEKDIRLYNPGKDSAGVLTQVRQEATIQFFPEGGDLVAGVENMVAFKANDQFGLPVSVKGVIQDHAGKELATFESVHDGMGKFLLTPDQDDSLTAIWRDEKGIEHRSGLPTLRAEGVALRVTSGNQKILLSLAGSIGDSPELHRVTLIAHMHQQQIYKARIYLHDGVISEDTISTGQLPSGVLTLTVFNANMAPVAERVVFVNNHQYLFHPNISIQTGSVARRGKDSLTIEVPDTLRSNLSLAVTDATADGEFPDDDNIISRLLLTGEIRGYVHDPYFYFASDADSLINMLDLVMLTHGWRRIKWDELVRGQAPVIRNPEQNYLALTADVQGVDSGKIASNESLNLILAGKGPGNQVVSLPHLGGGRFGASGLIFFDTTQVFYSFNVNRKLAAKAIVTLHTGLMSGGKALIPLVDKFEGWTAADSAYLRRNKYIAREVARVQPSDDRKVETLNAVTVKGHVQTAKEKLNEKYASGMFAGIDAYIFDLINDPSAPGWGDVFQYLQDKVPGLQIAAKGSGMSSPATLMQAPVGQPHGAPLVVNPIDTPYLLSWRGRGIALFLDEQQVIPDMLLTIPVSSIAMIKVFHPGFSEAIGTGAKGAIAVYTKRGGDVPLSDFNASPLTSAIILGYAAPKEFYSPNYQENSPVNEKEDLRTTLYWQPFVLTDKDNRRVTIDFFNNDISKKLRIVLEGFNEDGKLAHVEQIIQ